MATLVSANKLSKSFASKTLFSNLAFAIEEGEHIGLIGPNGAGKSTLLSIITKTQKPDAGQITFSNNLRTGYLKQKPELNPELNIYDTLIACCDDEYDSDNIQLAYELISKTGLDKFGDEIKTKALSGGWQKKLALACELMKKPNLLMLDEPTNHLDLESILWLEDFLQNQHTIALLIVTHDRRFLQNTCSVIFELDPQLPNNLLRTAGPYSSHVESKLMLLEGQKRLEEKRRNTMLREKEWLARGPQARLTKQKARIERAYDLIEETKELEQKNFKRALDLDFGEVDRSPKKLIEAKMLEKSYGNQILFSNFNAMIRPKHRYGLIGPNGAGKTTLLKCLIGQLAPDKGSINIAEGIDISYFEQGKDQIDLKKTVLQAVCPEGDYVHFQDQPVFARSYLNRFNFKTQQMDMPAAQLSGGELSRLILAKLMLKKSHVLILDEPTNDLDVETLESLTDCLSEYRGAVILVSHDRYFMDQNCDVIWAFDKKTKHIISFADTIQWEEYHKEQKKAGKTQEAKASGKQQRVGLSYKEKLEFESIESVIAIEEKKLAALQTEMAQPEVQADYSKLTEIGKQIADLEKHIEQLFERWEHLTQKAKENS